MSIDQPDLFGNSPYKRMVERYGIWPTTVWNVKKDKETQKLKQMIGDAGDERSGSFKKGGGVFKITASVFDPAIVAWSLNLFAPEAPAVVLDPFAGGGTRAVVSALKGYDYRGVELRHNETVAVNERLAAAGAEATVVTADARSMPYEDNSADFLITCPPYWNLETYKGGEDDLSMVNTYDGYLEMIGDVIDETARILKPNALAVWVTGLIRDEKTGELLCIPHDVARLHRAKFHMREEVILSSLGGVAMQRVGIFERGDRRLVRVHEYLSVFRKKTEEELA